MHKSITFERVEDAIDRQMYGIDNPGFCIVCGEDADGCEPDAKNYKCECCGERQVFGATEVLMMF